jgi:hypothetical protein
MKRFPCTLLVAAFLILTWTVPATALEFGARALYWFPSFQADMKSDGNGLAGTFINAKDTLGLENKNFPTVEAFAGLGNHRFTLGYTPISYSGSATLTSPVTFNGVNFVAGDRVDTDLKLRMLDLEYQYTFLDLDNILAGFSLGLIGQLKYLDSEAKMSAPAANRQAEFTGRLPIPMVGLSAHAGLLAGLLEARAKISGIGYSSSYLYEALADLSLTPFPFLDIHGGYKIIRVKIDQGGDFLDARFAGPFVALTVSF